MKTQKSQKEYFGTANVYKKIRIVKEDGCGAEIDFGYRVKQFKCKNGCEHHNHLVCIECGNFFYLDDSKLQDVQDQIAKDHGFKPAKHNFQILGICRNCR